MIGRQTVLAAALFVLIGADPRNQMPVG